MAEAQEYEGPPIPAGRIVGKASPPATWPLLFIGAPAALALALGSGPMRRAGAFGLAYLAWLWQSGRWPPQGTTPQGFYGGGRFAGTGAGR